jgi:hypothetical protein
MESRYGLAKRIWVMDRGMTSAENIAWLQQTGRRYVIGTSKDEIRKWSQQLADERDWCIVREGVETKLCLGPDGSEAFILCRSMERREKEKAMHKRFSERIEQGLASLARRMEGASKPLDRDAIQRQLGRLLQRNTRAAGRYDIQVFEDATRPCKLRLEWRVRSEWDDWARHSEGCYVLRSNVTDWSAKELWTSWTVCGSRERRGEHDSATA